MAQRVSMVLFFIALALLIGLQVWIVTIDYEQIRIGKYTALSPIMYFVYNVPSGILFVISQVVKPSRAHILIYAIPFFAMVALYFFLSPEMGYTFENP